MSKEKHSRASEQAMHENDAHQTNAAGEEVPPAEQSGHALSHAAHLSTQGSERTKPEGNLRQGSDPGALRQPPQGQGRT